MPRCKVCKSKFVARFSSLQPVCEEPSCKSKHVAKKKQLKQVSDKRSKENKIYLTLRKTFLNGKICPVTGKQATEVHHTNGRENDRLNDFKHWLAVSREGHLWIHANPKQAREKGWLK